MKQKDKFRYIEKCFYEYERNSSALKILENDLKILQNSTDVHAQSYEVDISHFGTVSDPVHQRVVKIEELEKKISFLERSILPAERVYQVLADSADKGSERNAELLEILKIYYFANVSAEAVMKKLHYSRSTLYLRRRVLVYMGLSYLG